MNARFLPSESITPTAGGAARAPHLKSAMQGLWGGVACRMFPLGTPKAMAARIADARRCRCPFQWFLIALSVRPGRCLHTLSKGR